MKKEGSDYSLPDQDIPKPFPDSYTDIAGRGWYISPMPFQLRDKLGDYRMLVSVDYTNEYHQTSKRMIPESELRDQLQHVAPLDKQGKLL